MNAPIVADIEFETVGAAQVLKSFGPFTYGFENRPLGSGLKVRYQVSSNSISLIDTGGGEWDWGAANASPGEAFLGDDTYVMEHPSPSITGDIQLGLARRSVNGVQLSYLTSGFFTGSAVGDPNGIIENFLFGYPTTSSDMPKTGAATYNVDVLGFFASPALDASYSLDNADASFSANFLDGTVSTWIDALGVNLNDPSITLDLGRWNGSGLISAGSAGFTGLMSGEDAASGQFAGAFFGPGAAELGFYFEIEQTAGPAPYIGFGQIVGRKN